MKKLLLTLSPTLVFASTLLAIPLTALIFQESAKLADKVTAWNNQCGDKPWYDEVCLKKRSELSGQLGQFVALVNNELNSLRNISPDASPDFVREATGRRKIMELEVRNALHVIRCLGALASDSECKAESAAIEIEKAVLETEYKQTHAVFDGNWISLRATVSPAPKETLIAVRCVFGIVALFAFFSVPSSGRCSVFRKSEAGPRQSNFLLFKAWTITTTVSSRVPMCNRRPHFS